MDLFEFDFFRDWELDQPCHVETERSALKRREWERRTQEVQQDEDLFSTGFNLFGEPYKTNKGDALANRVQNTLGSYEEMKDLLTSHSNQSHLVGIPKGSSTVSSLHIISTPAPERPAFEAQHTQIFSEGLRGGGGAGGGGGEGGMEKRPGNSASSSSAATSMQPPPALPLTPHQSSKKSRSSVDWSRADHGTGAQGVSLVLGLGQGQGQGSGRGKLASLEEQQREEDLFSSLKDELGLKGDSSPSSSSSSSSSSTGRRHSSHSSKSHPFPDRPSTMEGGHFKTAISTDSGGHVKASPGENEPVLTLLSSSSPLASTSVLTTPTPGLTTPTSGLTTPTFPPGSLSGKPIAVQQKPTAYVRPMDGQDQVPSDSPQLKPPLVATEGYSNSQAYVGNAANVKNKLPKLNLIHTGEVSLPNNSSCVEEILREMTHSWPPPLTAIHTPVKAEQTKFPIPNKESQHVASGYNTQKRCTLSTNKPVAKPSTAPQKSMLEDDLKISSDEEEVDQQVSDKPKARNTALSGASGSSSESESSSESDTDESESSSSDSEYNPASRTNTPEPEPASTNKWQLDSWLNKVQPQTKPLMPPQSQHHNTGLAAQASDSFSPGDEAPEVGVAGKNKACGANSTTMMPAQTTEHKETRAAFCPGREKGKAKLSQKASVDGQRSKMRMSPGLLSGSEVTTPRRNTTGKKQPRRAERSNAVEENQHPACNRTNQLSPPSRDKESLPPLSLEHQNPPRPRAKTSSGKMAPRKEPRSAANANSTVTPPAPTQHSPVTMSAAAVNQDKRKHRGPSSKITPKSREFIETESSSSASECHSDSEEPAKIPGPPPPLPPPPPTARPTVNAQTLSSAHAQTPQSLLLFVPGPVGGGAGNLSELGGKGLRVKDGSTTTSISSSAHSGNSSLANLSSSFGKSVPDPGGMRGLCKDPDPMTPPSILGMDLPLSPIRECSEVESLWVKIDLRLLSSVPDQRSAERAKGGAEEKEVGVEHAAERERDRPGVRDRDRPGVRERDRQRPEERDKVAKGERRDRQEEATSERAMPDLRAGDRAGVGERVREKVGQGSGCLEVPPVQEQASGRQPGRSERGENGNKHRRQTAGSAIATVDKHANKSKRKHKSEHTETSVNGGKRLRLDKDCQLLPPCMSPVHAHKNSSADSLSRKQLRRHEDKLLPPLLSPLADDPPRKRTCDGSSSLSQQGGAAATLPCSSSSCSSSSSSHRHRRGEGKAGSHAKHSNESDDHSHKPCGEGYNANGHSDTDGWSKPTLELTELRRPKLTISDTVHSADYYMQEAKSLKHKADALMDKFGKAVNYADGALSFIECGNAMERDPLEAKSPYTMYSETVELIRYAMRLKNFTSHSATVPEKKLAVLCNRCLSLLYLRMFHLKKEHAVKYSRSLIEYFKNSAKSSHQAPSPWRTNGKLNGTPSPLSLCPSPASSLGGGGGGSGGGSASSGSVAIPQRIHHMTASHVNITNNILRSYEHWETAERLASDSQEFFQQLDALMDPLSQQSSMTELVRYVRQGLHWLRIEAHLL